MHKSKKIIFMISTTLTFLLALVIVPTTANAATSGTGIFLDETFFPVLKSTTDTDGGTDAPGAATESASGVDARTTLGFVLPQGVLVGWTYNYYNSTSSRPAVAGGSESLAETISRSEHGPTLGYVNNGWRFLMTYFLSGTQSRETVNKDSSGATTGNVVISQAGMTGYQASAGYTFALGSSLQVGPSLVYRSVSYTTQEKTNRLNAAETYASTTLSKSKTETSLNPMLSMQFLF
jgi:hypothetical protein